MVQNAAARVLTRTRKYDHISLVFLLSTPRLPSGKDHWNQLSPYNLTLLQLEQTTGLSGQRRTGPPTELDDVITEFNNEMPLTETIVFNLVILH